MASHLTTISKGDLVAIRCETKAVDGSAGKAIERVVRVLKIAGGDLVVNDARREHLGDAERMTIPREDVLVNFGSKPGLKMKVFGYDLSRVFVETVYAADDWPVHWFYAATDEDKAAMASSVKAMRRWLRQNNLLNLIREMPLVFEVTDRRSKTIGHFARSKDLRKDPAVIAVNIQQFMREAAGRDEDDEGTPYGNMAYVLAHELGHALRFLVADRYPKHLARWVTLHEEYVTALQTDNATLDAIREAAKNAASFRDWKAAVKALSDGDEDADYKEVFTMLGSYLARVRGVPAKSLDILFQAERQEEVCRMIPSARVFVKRVNGQVLTKYACTNPEELLAEAFAFHVCGMKLPEKLEKLVEEFVAKCVRGLPLAIADLQATPEEAGD